MNTLPPFIDAPGDAVVVERSVLWSGVLPMCVHTELTEDGRSERKGHAFDPKKRYPTTIPDCKAICIRGSGKGTAAAMVSEARRKR